MKKTTLLSLLRVHYRQLFIVITLLTCATLVQTCTSPYFVATIRTKKSHSRWKSNIKVFIRFSSQSQFENRIAVINASDEKVVVYPVDITLNIPKANITIAAVMDFKEYVKMRHTQAKTLCAKSNKPTKCARYLNNIFTHYNEVEVFSFGEIPPKDKQNGYFAFDLPDPLNLSKQSKQAIKRLKNRGRTLRGTVRVVVRTVAIDPELREFNFPVKVLVSQKGKPKLLKILKYL